MKRAAVFVVSLLAAAAASGQDKNVAFGIIGSPDYYFYRFKPFPGEGYTCTNMLNSTFGLRVQFKIAEKLIFRTGTLYSRKNFSLSYNGVPSHPLDLVPSAKVHFRNGYIDVPIMLSYDFDTQKRLSFTGAAGLVASVLISEQQTEINKDGSTGNYFNRYFRHRFDETMGAFQIEGGAKYKLNYLFYLTAEPYARLGMNRISYNFLKQSPVSVGALFGVHVQL